MAEIVFRTLSYLFLVGVFFLGLDHMLLFANPTLVESVQRFVDFYEYIAWVLIVLALVLLSSAENRGALRRKERKWTGHSLVFYLSSLAYFVAVLTSVTILKDYSLGALFLLTIWVTSTYHSLTGKK